MCRWKPGKLQLSHPRQIFRHHDRPVRFAGYSRGKHWSASNGLAAAKPSVWHTSPRPTSTTCSDGAPARHSSCSLSITHTWSVCCCRRSTAVPLCEAVQSHFPGQSAADAITVPGCVCTPAVRGRRCVLSSAQDSWSRDVGVGGWPQSARVACHLVRQGAPAADRAGGHSVEFAGVLAHGLGVGDSDDKG